MREGLEEGVPMQETDGYSPVVDWGTKRMLLTMSVSFNLKTTQVDFKSAFEQKTLDRPLFVAMPELVCTGSEFDGKILFQHYAILY